MTAGPLFGGFQAHGGSDAILRASQQRAAQTQPVISWLGGREAIGPGIGCAERSLPWSGCSSENFSVTTQQTVVLTRSLLSVRQAVVTGAHGEGLAAGKISRGSPSTSKLFRQRDSGWWKGRVSNRKGAAEWNSDWRAPRIAAERFDEIGGKAVKSCRGAAK